jgi:surfeit locus 1 family protein
VIRFRPQPGFTLLCVALFALLVGLGVWQLERLQWKLHLIAEIRRNMHAPMISLDQALTLGLDRAQYRRVDVRGAFDNSKETYLYATGPDGRPVYHVLTPLLRGNGAAVIVDRGYVPLPLRNPALRPGSEPAGVVNVVGILRTSDKPGFFTPPPNLPHRVWFVRDVAAIAKRDQLRLAAPVVLEAVATAGGSWPRGGQTRVNIPNDHLQYAMTWFLLALALVAVYIAWNRAQGRLSFFNTSHANHPRARLRAKPGPSTNRSGDPHP